MFSGNRVIGAGVAFDNKDLPAFAQFFSQSHPGKISALFVIRANKHEILQARGLQPVLIQTNVKIDDRDSGLLRFDDGRN